MRLFISSKTLYQFILAGSKGGGSRATSQWAASDANAGCRQKRPHAESYEQMMHWLLGSSVTSDCGSSPTPLLKSEPI